MGQPSVTSPTRASGLAENPTTVHWWESSPGRTTLFRPRVGRPGLLEALWNPFLGRKWVAVPVCFDGSHFSAGFQARRRSWRSKGSRSCALARTTASAAFAAEPVHGRHTTGERGWLRIWRASDREEDGGEVATYVVLTNLTDQAIKGVKEVPQGIDQAHKAIEAAGGKVLACYSVKGEYDFGYL